MTEKETNREYDVVDMMISMHADLADAFSLRALLLSLGLLCASSFVLGFTFCDDGTLKLLGFAPDKARVGLGLASIALFALSILELKVDWSACARAHEDASKRLIALKAKYRRVKDDPTTSAATWHDLSRQRQEVMESIVAIPGRRFAALKARHLLKRQISVELGEHPGTPVIFVRLCVQWRATRSFFRGLSEDAPVSK